MIATIEFRMKRGYGKQKNIISCFLLQEPIFVPDPVISLAVEAKNKVKTNCLKVFIIVNCMLLYTLLK